MFRRTGLGLDICADGLRAVAVQNRRRKIVLTGGQILKFSDGVLRPSTRTPNVHNTELFLAALRDVLLPIAHKEERVALSLPDGCGYTFLVNVDTPLKSRNQSIDILKWQLKELLPDSFRDFALDYQVLSELESGVKRVLVSVIDNAVLAQYEDLVEEAGFHAKLIDFHSFQLYNCYRSKTDLGTDFMLVAVSGHELILLGFQGTMLTSFRVKTVGRSAEAVFREINRSLVSSRSDQAAYSRKKVYLHSDWDAPDELTDAVRSAFDTDVLILPDPLAQIRSGVQTLAVSDRETASMAAALGAAERLIEKVL